MKTDLKNDPRVFTVKGVAIKDYGKIHLKKDEMVSFVTESGKECDFAAKDWGFYLGPSLNSRLKKEGFKVALVMNENGQIYLNAVEIEKMDIFKEYLNSEQDCKIISWIDEWAQDK
jgi:hypothetical protein